MSKVLIGIADDNKEEIHDVFDSFIEDKQESLEIIHFYNTMDLAKYLLTKSTSLDMLFLDVVFKGGRSGLEALPDIKKIAPNLPVVILTGSIEGLNSPIIDNYMKEQLIYDYLEKPLSKKEFLNKINSIINIQNRITSSDQVLDELEQEYKQKAEEQYRKEILPLFRELDELRKNQLIKTRKEFNATDINTNSYNGSVPSRIKAFIKKVYSNLDFSTESINKIMTVESDPELFDLLYRLNNQLPLSYKNSFCLFHQWGVPDLYEYKFSQKSRLYLQKRKNQKPLVYDIDYNHDMH